MERPDVTVERSSESKFDRTLALMAAAAGVVLVVVVAVVAFQGLGEQPTDEEAIEVIAALDFAAPEDEGEGGLFVAGGDYEVESVEILGVTLLHDTTGSLYDQGMQSEYYVVEAVITATNGSVRATRYCSVWLGHREGFDTTWVAISDPIESGTSFEALVGLDAAPVEEDLASGASELLAEAGEGLEELYAEGTVTLEAGVFDADAQTTTFVITLLSETNLSTLEGTVTAVYAFEGGSWSLRGATASDGITEPSYQQLVGTWGGSLSAQVVSSGETCLSAEGHGLVVTIESVDDDTGVVAGTLSFVAHYHDALEEEATSTDGDTYLGNVSFELQLGEDFSATEGTTAGEGVAGYVGGSAIVDVGDEGLVELQLALVSDGSGGHLVAYVFTGYVAPEDEEADEDADGETDVGSGGETDAGDAAEEDAGTDADADGLFDASFGDLFVLEAQ